MTQGGQPSKSPPAFRPEGLEEKASYRVAMAEELTFLSFCTPAVVWVM